jgi:hypothetical protein
VHGLGVDEREREENHTRECDDFPYHEKRRMSGMFVVRCSVCVMWVWAMRLFSTRRGGHSPSKKIAYIIPSPELHPNGVEIAFLGANP